MDNLRALKTARAHFHTPEAMIMAVRRFTRLELMPVLMRCNMHFVHHLLSSSSRLADEVLAPARVLHLAALTLRMTKSYAWKGDTEWKWVAYFQDKDIHRFITLLLVDAPVLGKDAYAFAAGADDIERRACQYGPRMPNLSSEELQNAVQLCSQAGFLNEAVRNAEGMAAHVLDVLPGRFVEALVVTV